MLFSLAKDYGHVAGRSNILLHFYLQDFIFVAALPQYNLHQDQHLFLAMMMMLDDEHTKKQHISTRIF